MILVLLSICSLLLSFMCKSGECNPVNPDFVQVQTQEASKKFATDLAEHFRKEIMHNHAQLYKMKENMRWADKRLLPWGLTGSAVFVSILGLTCFFPFLTSYNTLTVKAITGCVSYCPMAFLILYQMQNYNHLCVASYRFMQFGLHALP